MKMARNDLSLLFLTTVLMPRVLGSGSHRCEIGQYWHTVLDTCRPCSDVCEPLTRPPCQQLCNDYFLSIVLPRTMDMLTSTTQPISHTQPISYTNASEKNLQLIVAVPILLLMVIMAVVIPTVCIRYGKKDKNTRLKTLHTQETDDTRSSEMSPLAGLLEHNDNANDTVARQEDIVLNIDDGKFLPLRTPQTGSRCDPQSASENGDHASIDNDKTNWSTTAIYDKKNNCMKLEGMHRFPPETNV